MKKNLEEMKKNLIYGAMAIGLIFSACNSEEPLAVDNGSGNGVAPTDQTLYVNMSIHGDIGTRAAENNGAPSENTDFDAGTGESEVQNAYFVFYDDAGNVVGDIVPVTLDNPATDNSGPTVEKYYKSVVPVSVRKGENYPTQVVCYVNPLSPAALQNPLSVIQAVTRKEVKTNAAGKTLFPMSNSVYYVNNSDAEPQIAVTIAKDQLYPSKEEAAAAGNEAINIYVERYAAKLKFTATDATPYSTHTVLTENNTEVPVTLTFITEKWALNAEATTTYVVKSFREPSSTGQMLGSNFAYNMLNTQINLLNPSTMKDNVTENTPKLDINDAWVWNNAAYHRSYWGVSPAYFTDTYPVVGTDATDDLNQHYYSYKELSEGEGFSAASTNAEYFRETTVGLRALHSENPAAATPSVILVGHYEIDVNGTKAPANSEFYTYLTDSDGHPLVYFANRANSAESAVAGGESMLKRFLAQTTVLYKLINGSYVRYNINNEADLNKLTANLEVATPPTNGQEKFDPNRRTLQFKENANTVGIYVANGNGYKQISDKDANTGITLAEANKVLRQQVGYAVCYNLGRGFFNIPVKHYGWYREGNPQKNNNSTHIDWSKVRVGDFGLVRNHSYSIEINKIEGLASGIGGEDTPIVPPADTKEYYVAYKVNILKWAVVPMQNVVL